MDKEKATEYLKERIKNIATELEKETNQLERAILFSLAEVYNVLINIIEDKMDEQEEKEV